MLMTAILPTLSFLDTCFTMKVKPFFFKTFNNYQNLEFFLTLNPLPKQSLLRMTRGKKAFENIPGKGENVGNRLFLLFRNLLYPSQSSFQYLKPIYLLSANAVYLDLCSILLSSKKIKC